MELCYGDDGPCPPGDSFQGPFFSNSDILVLKGTSGFEAFST
jgi:hypothetical protein